MPQPPETTRDYEVQISQEYHAFLVCNTQITDSGRGKQVQLEIQKHKHRAVISFEALRSTANLNGHWRATLHIRCQADATLDHTMSLRRLRSITAENQHQPAFWSCTGDIGHFNPEQGILEIQIYPERQYGHLEMVFLAAIAGALGFGLAWRVTFTWLSLGAGILVFAVLLWSLEQWCGRHLEVIYKVFPRFPMGWYLMLVSGIYGFNLASMLQLPSWVVLIVILLSIGGAWSLVGMLLQQPLTQERQE